jgi:hypothetical protein
VNVVRGRAWSSAAARNAGLCACLLAAAVATADPAVDHEKAWRLSRTEGAITVSVRDRAGTGLRESKATGVLNAAAADLHAVLLDAERFEEFMPYTIEARVVGRVEGGVLAYQRLRLPVVADRDYVVSWQDDSHTVDGATVYGMRWRTAAGGPPPVDGVVRVKLTEGRWRLEPLPDGRTRATYQMFADIGGDLPVWLVNMTNDAGLPALLQAVEKRAQQQAAGRAPSSPPSPPPTP